MKKLILIIGLIGIISTNLFSQRISIKGGMNISKILSKDNVETYGSNKNIKLGLNIGVATEFSLNKRFAIETGINLDSKGYRVKKKDLLEEYSETIKTLKIYYIDIPINAKYIISDNSFKTFITAGPYIGIGIYGNLTTEIEGNKKISSVNKDIEWGEDFNPNRLDYGLNIGIGAEYKFLSFSINYSHGLPDLSLIPNKESNVTNSVLSFSCGYIFKQF